MFPHMNHRPAHLLKPGVFLTVWTRYPLVLDGEAALELPGAAGHPAYPLALAVSAMFASDRADVTAAEELSCQAAEANAGQPTPDWRGEETVCGARASIARSTGAFADAARFGTHPVEVGRPNPVTGIARLGRTPLAGFAEQRMIMLIRA